MQNTDHCVTNIFKDSSAQRRRAGPKLRVLAVDDDPDILQVLSSALNSLERFEVSVADSAESALNLIEQEQKQFDCLVLDIQMPNTNGIDLCKQIRGIRAYRDTPVIMLTAMTDRSYVDQAFVAGATDFLSKPFDLFELRIRMTAAQRLIEERRLAGVGLEVARKLKAELDTVQKCELNDAIAFADVDRMLQFAEFTNYVMQLSRGYLFNAYATPIKVCNVANLYASLDSNLFRKGLHDVSLAISLTTKRTGEIFTYRGNGIFLAINTGRSSDPLSSCSEKLNQVITTLHEQRQAETPFQVEIGQRLPMRTLSKSGALSLMHKAAEITEPVKRPECQKSPMLKRVVLRHPKPGARPIKSDQGIYEKVLRDIFKDEPNLSAS